MTVGAETKQPGQAFTGHSGHSRFRKSRFAGTLASVYLSLTITSIAKDFYLEKLGADPIVMGVLFFIVSFCGPFNEILSGRLQNGEALKRCFPLQAWGRKAPWLLTHIVILAVASGVLYMPPSNTILVHVWFTVFSILIFWAISTCLIAFESCRQEIYPYNEERAEVEVLCKFGCIVGMGTATLPMLLLAAHSTLMLRAASSVLFFIGVLVFGMQALPVWMEAKSLSGKEEDEKPSFRDFVDTLKNNAFRHLCFVRMYEGVYQGIQSTNLLYYLTYILQLKGAERSLWMLLTGACNMVGDIAVALLVGKAMEERKNAFKIQSFVVWFRIVNAVTTVVLLAYPWSGSDEDISVTRGLFLIWVTLNRICQSPFSFWRVAAQCWVVDEDIHKAENGTRREAAFIAVASAGANFARSFAGSMAFLGYGLAGLQPRDCNSQCGSDATLDCLDACMEVSIQEQPDELRSYIRMLNIVGLVVVELLMIYHTHAFPIRGIRLARLYNNQAQMHGSDVDGGTPAHQMERLSMSTMMDMVKAQPSNSIVVMDCDAKASLRHVHEMQRHNRHGRISTSVIFGPTLEQLRLEDVTDKVYGLPPSKEFADKEQRTI